MSTQTFRHYTICQDQQGATVEVWRSAEEVACLAFDNKQQLFVELHVAIGPAERQRDAPAFQNLVQLAAPLRHRHLLGVIEGGEDEGANYHVSEFLDGERLDSWLARNHPVPPWLALLVIRQLVEGLAALASHPRLLAGVEVFHAGLTLAGPHSSDLVVKVCDLGLSGVLPVSTEPQFVEARAIHDTGRLLLYMLTGSLTEGAVTADSLAGYHIPPELGFLLGTIFTATQPHHPRTLEQLRTLTLRCTQDLSPELTAPPDLLPAACRPRLPLTPHLSGPMATADWLSNDYTVDTRAGDSADPYRQRATQRATRRAVNVQLLPPANLMPAPFLLPALEKAWTSLAPGPAAVPPAPLLVPLAYHPESPSPLLVEELPGKYTLDTLHRLRHPLEPAEVLLILTQLDAAATAAGERGLPLHWRSPVLIPVQFTGPGGEEALPPAAQLARLPLTEWPPFQLKVRTWPITLDFTQPDRFQLERLLLRDPALSGEAPAPRAASGALPSGRDFALLTTWLLGGTPRVPDPYKSLLYSAISARGASPATRPEFLGRFRQRVHGGSTAPVTPAAAPGRKATAPVPTLTLGKPKNKARLKTSGIPIPATPAPESAMAPAPAAAAGLLSLPPGLNALEMHGQDPVLTEAEPAGNFPVGRDVLLEEAELPPMGFAEALFGASLDQSSGELSGASWPAGPIGAGARSDHGDPPPGAPQDEYPLGFMEAAGQSRPLWNQQDYDAYPDEEEEGRPAGSGRRWMLFLLVVLIAAALAGLMAQLSGQAIWLK